MATSTKTSADCCGNHSQRSCQSCKRRGVLLVNLGTPDACTKQSVRQYLTQFLADPYVIKLPKRWKWLNWPLARMIAQFRSGTSTEAYNKVWTDRGSPLKFITKDQVCELQKHMGGDWKVFYAMRYAQPSIGDTIKQIVAEGVTDLVVIPMYPQYSGPTIGTALDELYRCVRRFGLELNIEVRNTWYQDAGYIEAQASLIHEQALIEGLNPDDTMLLYSTHSLPQSYITDGDPYEGQIRHSVELVNKRLGWPSHRSQISFQSKLGPVKWLEPSTETALKDLAAAGEKRVLVCPISFTADCLETIEEVGMTYAGQFEKAGGRLFLCPALNTYEPFIKTLASLVRRGSHPRNGEDFQCSPLFDTSDASMSLPEAIDSLTMIGVCKEGRLDNPCGPTLSHVTPAEFLGIKRSQFDTLNLLEKLHSDTGCRESWLWNTCSRFEFYGLFNGDQNDDSFQETIDEVSRQLVGDHQTDLKLNVLHGADAWHHLLRSASGFHSSLPGDMDILEQLKSSHRMAQHVNTAGKTVENLMSKVQSIVKEVRTTTSWGKFSCQYCYAALGKLLGKVTSDISKSQCVVIGGSTTSRSILQILVERFDVPSENLTLVYRGGGRRRLMKLLRQVIGHGTKLLVHKYSEPAVSHAIAEADVVLLGVDRKEPILTSASISGLRDFIARPLAIIDFNSFGSCEESISNIEGITVIDAAALEAEVTRYADILFDNDELQAGVEAAERLIDAEVRTVKINGESLQSNNGNHVAANSNHVTTNSNHVPASSRKFTSTFGKEGDNYVQPTNNRS